jgi:hypothetical protein
VSDEISPRKLAANRRNAQKSTGPRTQNGRYTARLNAVKHGLLSQFAVVQSSDGSGSQKEFDTLRAMLFDELAPIGTLETLLVDRIAMCFWKLRRASAHEQKELELMPGRQAAQQLVEALDDMHVADTCLDELQRELVRVLLVYPYMRSTDDPTEDHHRKIADARQTLKRTDRGVGFLLKEAFVLRAAIEGNTFCFWLCKEALVYFGGYQGSLGWRLLQGVQAHIDKKMDPMAHIDVSSELKPRLLSIIDDEIETLTALANGVKLTRQTGQRKSTVLATEAGLDRLLRYETSVERQLYRALAELERRQRSRRGEFVAPPVKIDVQ